MLCAGQKLSGQEVDGAEIWPVFSPDHVFLWGLHPSGEKGTFSNSCRSTACRSHADWPPEAGVGGAEENSLESGTVSWGCREEQAEVLLSRDVEMEQKQQDA